jgi:hypothetical protein
MLVHSGNDGCQNQWCACLPHYHVQDQCYCLCGTDTAKCEQSLSVALCLVLLVLSILVIYFGRRASIDNYSPGRADEVMPSPVFDHAVVMKPCGAVNPLPALPALLAANISSSIPSTHCLCAWGGSACDGWRLSSLVQIITPVVVSAPVCASADFTSPPLTITHWDIMHWDRSLW